MNPLDEDDAFRIYVIPILIRINHQVNERDYINFIITELINDYVNSFDNESKLSDVEFNKLNRTDQHFECSICMDNKHNGILLNCNHIFCEDCLKKWLTTVKNTCPSCRKEVEI